MKKKKEIFPVYIYLHKYGAERMGKTTSWGNKETVIKVYRPEAQIINFNQVIFEENMKEKQKTQTFIIKGKKHYLLSFEQDLKEIGYYFENTLVENKYIHNSKIKFGKTNDYTRLCYLSENWKADKTFNLPEQYSEALQFCKEQLKIAEEYFKEEIPEYIECLKDIVGGNTITKGKIYKVIKEDCNNYQYGFINNNNNRDGFSKLYFRPSTKEAYEAQNRLTFGGNEVTIHISEDTCRIQCKGEVGTYEELLKIYNKYKDEKLTFGSKSTYFKGYNVLTIGCTAGSLEEIEKIINRCKELLNEK